MIKITISQNTGWMALGELLSPQTVPYLLSAGRGARKLKYGCRWAVDRG
jgi:hypothetical protein